MNDRCLAGDYCVALTTDGSAITSQPLCHGCVNKLQDQYDELPAILEVLPMFKGGLWGTSGEAKVATGKGEAPSPLNVGCVDAIDLINYLLADIGSLRIVDLVRHQDGVARALLVGSAWKQADSIIGISRKWERRFLPCSSCGLRTLGSLAGSDVIHCTTCGHSMSREEYESICLIGP